MKNLCHTLELPPSIVSGKPVSSPAAHSMVGAAGAASLGPHHYTPQLNSPALSNSPSSTAPLALPSMYSYVIYFLISTS